MKIKIALVSVFFSLFIFCARVYCNLLTTKQESMKQQELETYLKTAKVGPDMKLMGGRTEAYVVSLDDGKIKRRGVFKVTDRTRPTALPDSYKYGIAAYELDKLLDLNRVPATVLREIEGRKGSLMIFLEGALREKDRRLKKIEPPDPKAFENALEEIKVLENLAYSRSLCGQKDLGDILIMDKEDWKVWAVDFSEAFDPRSELVPDCPITRCSRKLYQNLMKLDDSEVKAKLKPYLNDEEIKALLQRKGAIINRIKQLIQEKGEEAVLFL
jgi:hypothetical protein